MTKWRRLLYTPVSPLEDKVVTGSIKHIEASKRAASEAMVLLKNDDGFLPLKENKLAVFGKASIDYVKGGGGSGDVHCAYVTNIQEGLDKCFSCYEPLSSFYRDYVSNEYEKGERPGLIAEPSLTDVQIKEARKFSEVAILCLSRFSGENWDRLAFPKEEDYKTSECFAKTNSELFGLSDFFLSPSEQKLTSQIMTHFDKVVVLLNTGGVMETAWIKDRPEIKAAVLVSQLGMDGGCAVAELLSGKAYPSGKLVDTFARDIFSYPNVDAYHSDINSVEYSEDIFVGYRYFNTFDKAKKEIVYPFGYGLGYTTFEINFSGEHFEEDFFTAEFTVINTGNFRGKEVVQLYASQSEGKLDKAKRILVGFQKTRELKPGESEKIEITVPLSALASYDDEGLIKKSAYLIEKGNYNFYTSLEESHECFSYTFYDDLILKQVTEKLAPSRLTKRLRRDGEYYENTTNKERKTLDNILPPQVASNLEGVVPLGHLEDRVNRVRLKQLQETSFVRVAEGKLPLKEFIASLSVDELIELTGGQPGTGVANTYGFGNLKTRGIPNVMTADGPAGLRIDPECGIPTTAWPCATALAQTWNPEIVEEVGYLAGREVKENNIGIWLTPAVNIHRNPVCGRNFEYYSEDPLVAGVMASSMVKGIQRNGIGACVKHFACNNKESNRKESDSILSERAAREIYLKPFEYIVEHADPYSFMSSYNTINGVRAAENKELLTDILRVEWSFKGFVFSDWWNHSEHYKELLAGEDVKMGTGYPNRVKDAYVKGAITREDLEKNVTHMLSVILRLE